MQISGSTISAEDGKAVQVDAIIWATGFDVSQPLRSIDIRGLGGRTLADTLAAKPQVYLGVAVAGVYMHCTRCMHRTSRVCSLSNLYTHSILVGVSTKL